MGEYISGLLQHPVLLIWQQGAKRLYRYRSSVALKNQLALDNSTVEFVKAVYPLTAYENITHKAVAKVQTDFGFSCPSLKAARVFRKNRNLYFYVSGQSRPFWAVLKLL